MPSSPQHVPEAAQLVAWPSLEPKQMREIKALLRDPDTQVADMAQRYGVSRTTVYKYVEVIKPKDIFEAHH